MRTYGFRDLKPAGVPFTRKHITTLEKRAEFPMHFNVGVNSVLWVAYEVDAWVERKIRARRATPNGASPSDQSAAKSGTAAGALPSPRPRGRPSKQREVTAPTSV
jgi:hypothetical protein